MKKEKLLTDLVVNSWSEEATKDLGKVFFCLGENLSYFSSEDDRYSYEDLERVLGLLEEEGNPFSTRTVGGEYFAGTTGVFNNVPFVVFSVSNILSVGSTELFIDKKNEKAFLKKIKEFGISIYPCS